MLDRTIVKTLKERLARYPAVAIIGPRQCGKTTLAKSLKGNYFDLELDQERLRLNLTWTEVINKKQLTIFDEAQEAPDIFPRLRNEIDSKRNLNGRFLLVGSVSPNLMRHVSESLAGRLALVEMSPLTSMELVTESQKQQHWFLGGYPGSGLLNSKTDFVWHENYLALMSQRDLPNWGLSARPAVTARFMGMLAHLHGTEWNASQIGKSLSLSYHTVNNYLDYFENAFLIRRLASYHRNIGKRLVKRPKVYWRDSGILHALWKVPDSNSLLRLPQVGNSWEGYVIEQLLSTLQNRDYRFSAYFARTTSQREIDLLLDINSELWAIDIKLTSNPHPALFTKFKKTAQLFEADKRVLICRTSSPILSDKDFVCDLETTMSLFSKEN